MAVRLQVLDEQPLSPFDDDGDVVAVVCELPEEFTKSGDIVGDSQLQLLAAGVIDEAELMLVASPVHAAEDTTMLYRIQRTSDP